MSRKRNGSGAFREKNGRDFRIGTQAERSEGLTSPREWPNQAAANRDESAEHVNDAVVILQGLLDGRVHDDKEVLTKIAQANYHLLTALRWLELAGASTRPIRRV